MNTKQVTHKHRRLPGEVAFDRCFLPLVSFWIFNIVFFFVGQGGPSKPRSEAELAAETPPPIWQAWLWFAIGLVLAAFWFRAVITLTRAWQDPSSRVLRFSASVLLIPFANSAYRLLLTPFQ